MVGVGRVVDPIDGGLYPAGISGQAVWLRPAAEWPAAQAWTRGCGTPDGTLAGSTPSTHGKPA